VIAAAVLAVGFSTPARAANVVQTKFRLDFIFTVTRSKSSFDAWVTGQIEAAKTRCTNRKVILYFKRGRHRRHVRDVGHSRHHRVSLAGQSRSEPDRLIVRVTKKRVANHGHPYTCWPDHQTFNLRRFFKETEGTRGPHGAVRHRITFPRSG
jgi:hypothetical protein